MHLLTRSLSLLLHDIERPGFYTIFFFGILFHQSKANKNRQSKHGVGERSVIFLELLAASSVYNEDQNAEL